VEFAEDALAVLRAHHWPGNLVEFNQVISRIIGATETRVITAAQLPLRLHDLKHWPSLANYLAGQEKEYIAKVLHASHGDKARAAKLLGVDVGRLG